MRDQRPNMSTWKWQQNYCIGLPRRQEKGGGVGQIARRRTQLSPRQVDLRINEYNHILFFHHEAQYISIDFPDVLPKYCLLCFACIGWYVMSIER